MKRITTIVLMLLLATPVLLAQPGSGPGKGPGRGSGNGLGKESMRGPGGRNRISFFDSTAHVGSLGFLPLPPERGTERFYNDSICYEWGKTIRPTERGELAVSDAAMSSDLVIARFLKAIGKNMKREDYPETFKLLETTVRDCSSATGDSKDFYHRTRPYVEFNEPTSVPEKEESTKMSGSYPSGHATTGWAMGLILSELFPECADSALACGYEYGQSRVITGYHYQSDVDAAKMVASGVFAQLHAVPKFQEQLSKAKAELGLTKSAPKETTLPSTDPATELRNPNGKKILMASSKGDWHGSVPNSLHALQKAWEKGATIALVDIDKTSDGQIVLALGQPDSNAADKMPKKAPSLAQTIEFCRGKILLLVDPGKYSKDVAAIVKICSAQDVVVFADKAPSGFMYMPTVDLDGCGAIRKVKKAISKNPVAVELRFKEESNECLTEALSLLRGRCRVCMNTSKPLLSGPLCDPRPGDDPRKVWKPLIDKGASVIVTDQTKSLMQFLSDKRN